jgi:hypothetical protein
MQTKAATFFLRMDLKNQRQWSFLYLPVLSKMLCTQQFG